jgi:hypothetical protein
MTGKRERRVSILKRGGIRVAFRDIDVLVDVAVHER